MAELAHEEARAQAWEILLEKAREVHQEDPKAAAAAKTLLKDPAWKQVIKADVTATTSEVSEPEKVTAGAVADGGSEEYTKVPWEVVYPGYINGKLAFGVPFDEELTEKEGTLVIEDISWGSAA
jgi:hypothetical protein